jgi:hypothetical protein
MMTDNTTSQAILQSATPDAALKRLESLLGTWNMTGHTLNADEDNITGWNTFEWLPGGFFMKSSGELTFMGTKLWSMEIIGYDPARQTFASKVYSSLSGDMLDYGWDVQGNIVTHWDKTSIFTGTLSDDGSTLIGGWRPKDGEDITLENAYDVVMTRVR